MPAAPPLTATQLLKEVRVESNRLEFKVGWDEQTAPAIVKTVCAFANDLQNQNGGYVILGVREAGGAPQLPPEGLAEADLEALQKRVLGQVQQWIRPSYTPVVSLDRVDGRAVLVLYCPAGRGGSYQAPDALTKGAPTHPRVRVGPETKRATGELLRQLNEHARPLPFDAQPRHDLTPNDIDPTLLRGFFRDHLGQERAGGAADVTQMLRDLSVLHPVNGHHAPTHAAALLFTPDPARTYPGARVEIVRRTEDDDTVFSHGPISGPLPSIITQAIEVLKGLFQQTLVQRRPDQAAARRVDAWPFEAVREALVNALHHRGYEPVYPDPVKIHVYPDRMTITSYPGPVQGVRLEHLSSGDLPRVPSRNRHVGELLRMAGLAEALRSGVRKIHRAMRDNGNPPPQLIFDEPERSFFEVVLPIHPEHLPRPPGLPLRPGRPAPPEDVLGREALVQRALAELAPLEGEGPRGLTLLAPRGQGVSSVLGALEARAPLPTLRFDLHRSPIAGVIRALDELPGPTWVLLDHAGPSLEGDEGLALARALRAALDRVAEARAVVALHSPGEVSEEVDQAARWWATFPPLVVPPLDPLPTRELARRLLIGAGVAEVEPLALALDEVSRGLPAVVVALVQRLAAEPERRTPQHLGPLLEELVVQRGDPTGLKARLERAKQQFEEGPSDSVGRALSRLPEGRSRPELVGEGRLAGWPGLALQQAIARLLEEGLVVERGGRLALAHALLDDRWRLLPPDAAPEERWALGLGYNPDDVPFQAP